MAPVGTSFGTLVSLTGLLLLSSVLGSLAQFSLVYEQSVDGAAPNGPSLLALSSQGLTGALFSRSGRTTEPQASSAIADAANDAGFNITVIDVDYNDIENLIVLAFVVQSNDTFYVCGVLGSFANISNATVEVLRFNRDNVFSNCIPQPDNFDEGNGTCRARLGSGRESVLMVTSTSTDLTLFEISLLILTQNPTMVYRLATTLPTLCNYEAYPTCIDFVSHPVLVANSMMAGIVTAVVHAAEDNLAFTFNVLGFVVDGANTEMPPSATSVNGKCAALTAVDAELTERNVLRFLMAQQVSSWPDHNVFTVASISIGDNFTLTLMDEGIASCFFDVSDGGSWRLLNPTSFPLLRVSRGKSAAIDTLVAFTTQTSQGVNIANLWMASSGSGFNVADVQLVAIGSAVAGLDVNGNGDFVVVLTNDTSSVPGDNQNLFVFASCDGQPSLLSLGLNTTQPLTAVLRESANINIGFRPSQAFACAIASDCQTQGVFVVTPYTDNSTIALLAAKLPARSLTFSGNQGTRASYSRRLALVILVATIYLTNAVRF